MRLCAPVPMGMQRIPSTLKARRANRPQMCDITPGWLLTVSSNTTCGLSERGGVGVSGVSSDIDLPSNHIFVGSTGGHHWIDLLLSVDRGVDQAWSRCAQGTRQRGVWIRGSGQIIDR